MQPDDQLSTLKWSAILQPRDYGFFRQDIKQNPIPKARNHKKDHIVLEFASEISKRIASFIKSEHELIEFWSSEYLVKHKKN